MPSREEISELLQEAADAVVSCQIDFKLFHRLKECAGQVENMHCGRCKRYKKYQRCDYHKAHFMPDEGCFSWEAK